MRAKFTARRKELYEYLHPETRNGENQHTRVRQVGEGSTAARFTADTAARTGQSERSVQRDAERGEKVAERFETVRRRTDLAWSLTFWTCWPGGLSSSRRRAGR